MSVIIEKAYGRIKVFVSDGDVNDECLQQGIILTKGRQAETWTVAAVLYEWEIDAQGNAQTPLWEWK